MKAALLSWVNAIIVAMARVNGDPKYKSYKNGYGLKKPAEHFKTSGVDLSNGGGLEALQQFQQYLSEYKIIVIDGLYPDRSCLVEFPFRLRNYLLYDRDFRH